MNLAEVSVPLETIAGGSVTAMLVAVMTAVLRRTKEADERQDEFTKVVVATAAEREARAWAERDAAREELALLKAQLEKERQEWSHERVQLGTPPPQPQSPPQI